ncbi:MAG: carbon-nitrogen hydrolase [Bacteroidetes bacterium]|nr:carbon-nitrogen hydrolase [Bacteroidota bacterium]
MITLAAIQYSPVRAGIRDNLATIDVLTRTVRTDLLVLPELANTGYFFTDREELLPLAEDPERGAFCSWMRGYAAEHQTVVVGGFAERDARDRLFNAALIALPDGSARVYRKTHLFYKEHLVFEPGDSGFFVVEWAGYRIGAMICYDWRFPESSRTLALRGADVIAHPSNLVAAASLWGPAMAMRAIENKVIVVTANRAGEETSNGETLRFTGESRITGMNGAILSIADPTEARGIVADADPVATRGKAFNAFNDLFADRRPDMYEC